MAVTRISQSSLKQGLKKNKNFVADIQPVLGRYESISTATASTGSSVSFTFSNIPQGYKHLQIRGIVRCNTGNNYVVQRITVNDDNTQTNYRQYNLYGSGSAVGSGTSQNNYCGTVMASNAIANNYVVNIIDILNYSSTNQYKTFRAMDGYDNAGNSTGGHGYIYLESMLWINTAPITKLVLEPYLAYSFAQYSTYALYGVK